MGQKRLFLIDWNSNIIKIRDVTAMGFTVILLLKFECKKTNSFRRM